MHPSNLNKNLDEDEYLANIICIDKNYISKEILQIFTTKVINNWLKDKDMAYSTLIKIPIGLAMHIRKIAKYEDFNENNNHPNLFWC